MFKKDHKFKTSKQDNRSALMRFFYAFLAFALVFGTISAAVILKHNDISVKDIFSGKASTSASEEGGKTTALTLDKELTGRANILLYCADTRANEIYFMILVDADMDSRVFRVHPLNPDVKAYTEALATGGCKELVPAVEKREGVAVDKYIASASDTFALAINYMGGLEYYVDERIEYRTDDYTLILTRGNQTIKGETLLKYFRYCKTLGVDGMRWHGKLIAAMLDGYINSENVENGIEIYQKVLSKLNSASDISYIEASKAMQMLAILCKSDERQAAKVILSEESIAR